MGKLRKSESQVNYNNNYNNNNNNNRDPHNARKGTIRSLRRVTRKGIDTRYKKR